MRITLNLFSLVMSLASLSYSAILLSRVIELGVARLASDTIVLAYLTSSLAFISGLFLFKMFKGNDNILLKKSIFVLGIISAVVWYGLHLSGYVYSHANAFNY